MCAHDFQQAQRGHTRFLARRLGDFETQADMALPGEMIQLCRANIAENSTQGRAIGEIAIVEK